MKDTGTTKDREYEKKERLAQQFDYLEEMGVEFLVRGEDTTPEAATSQSRQTGSIEQFYKAISGCTRCPLHQKRTNIVPGEGNPRAGLMFIGEAPGADEDRLARPFVGRAGQLLTKIIEAMGLAREDVYIANIIKCRPENNRNPLPVEIAACLPYIQQQIELVSPKVICALGSISAATLLKTDTGIGRMRGRFHDYHGIKVMPTYHPAYLLRNPSAKKPVWEDIKMIMASLALKQEPTGENNG